ncbi:hypothetical protein [uncultured Jatrophihabitans sp.]|uniref:hypothetical protein n=1 Tax=uncultured Jatrophihabitans sp. TaxID=1610747 RepID=UPI0035CA91F8
MTYSAYPNQPAYPGPGNPGDQGSGKPKLRGRTPLRLAIIFFVLAVILFVIGGVVLAKKSLGKVEDFQRVSISSGTGMIKIDGTGKWVGYYEASDVSSDIDRIPNIRVAISDPSGKAVTFKSYGNRSDDKVDKLTYNTGGHKGAAALQFTAKTEGTYRILVQPEETLPSGAQLAFGRDIAKGTAAGGLLIVGGVLLLIAAIVLLIVGLIKRSRHKKELANPYGGGGYGGPPANYPPPGYGPPPGGPQPGGYGQPGPQPGGYGQSGPQPGGPPQAGPQQGWGPPQQ